MFDWFDEMKASIEKGIAEGIAEGIKALGNSFNENIGQWFHVPEPAEPYKLIRVFNPANISTITQDGITVEENGWKIQAYGAKKVLLFEIAEPSSECLIMCEAQIKTANLYKPAKLTLSNKNPAGWTIHRHTGIEGTTAWHTHQVPFHYRKENFPGSILVSIEFESGGVFCLKNVEILQAPIKANSEKGKFRY